MRRDTRDHRYSTWLHVNASMAHSTLLHSMKGRCWEKQLTSKRNCTAGGIRYLLPSWSLPTKSGALSSGPGHPTPPVHGAGQIQRSPPVTCGAPLEPADPGTI